MNIKRHYRPEKVKKYEARWHVEGRLKCRFFATEKERERFIDEFQEQLSQNGTSLLLGFDPTKMRRWQEASRLAPDADPVEVMQFWLASNRPNLKPKRLDSDLHKSTMNAYFGLLIAVPHSICFRMVRFVSRPALSSRCSSEPKSHFRLLIIHEMGKERQCLLS